MTSNSNFHAAWWLNNAHLQTIYPSLCRRLPPINCLREQLIMPDADFMHLDFYGAEHQALVILLHGLTGSAQSGYIQGLQLALDQQGFSSVAVNFRGCSGVSNNTAKCYHSGETEDLAFVYQALRNRYPQRPIAAVGFSLGGNVLLKWLGESQNTSLFAAVAVSVPLVLSICATRLDQGYSRIYRQRLLKELKEYLDVKQQHLLNIGQQREAEKIQQLGDVTAIESFWQYDDQVVAPLYGFLDVHDYYQKSSSRQYLKRIQVPSLLIQADDDPFMTQAVLPTANELANKVQLQITRGGGHVGFVSGHNPLFPVYWLEQRIPAFLSDFLLS